ncbi:MAG: STN domain-containing protein [Segetibacter sp.]
MFTLFAAGQNKTISGEFYNIKFSDFVKQAEAGKAFHFYYNEAKLNSFTVNIKLTDQTIEEALQQIFANTDFHFSIDATNNIFITKNRSLQTTLPKDFFNPGIINITDEIDTSQIADKRKRKARFYRK